jgi:hypothetical protein
MHAKFVQELRFQCRNIEHICWIQQQDAKHKPPQKNHASIAISVNFYDLWDCKICSKQSFAPTNTTDTHHLFLLLIAYSTATLCHLLTLWCQQIVFLRDAVDTYFPYYWLLRRQVSKTWTWPIMISLTWFKLHWSWSSLLTRSIFMSPCSCDISVKLMWCVKGSGPVLKLGSDDSFDVLDSFMPRPDAKENIMVLHKQLYRYTANFDQQVCRCDDPNLIETCTHRSIIKRISFNIWSDCYQALRHGSVETASSTMTLSPSKFQLPRWTRPRQFRWLKKTSHAQEHAMKHVVSKGHIWQWCTKYVLSLVQVGTTSCFTWCMSQKEYVFFSTWELDN